MRSEKVSDYIPPNLKGYGFASRIIDVEDRLHRMIDLVAWVPTKDITIAFLNSSAVITLIRRGRTPEQFAQEAHQVIRTTFSRLRLSGNSTPLRERMEAIIPYLVQVGIATSIYIMTDGQPNNYEYDIQRIQALLFNGIRSENAQMFPVTFIGCSNQPRQLEWTRELEEESEAGSYMLYIAAIEDYPDEQKLVQQFQGPGFEYHEGLYLVASAVAALDPNGLDAMDQPEPLTKAVYDFLSGWVHSDAEYRDYFALHPYARQFFQGEEHLFIAARTEGEIPSVIQFRMLLSQSLKRDIENRDDFSEYREIDLAGQQIILMRQQGIFNADNQRLLDDCQRQLAAAAAATIQPGYQAAASAPLLDSQTLLGNASSTTYGTMFNYTPGQVDLAGSAPPAGLVAAYPTGAPAYPEAIGYVPPKNMSDLYTYPGAPQAGRIYRPGAYSAGTSNSDDCCTNCVLL